MPDCRCFLLSSGTDTVDMFTQERGSYIRRIGEAEDISSAWCERFQRKRKRRPATKQADYVSTEGQAGTCGACFGPTGVHTNFAEVAPARRDRVWNLGFAELGPASAGIKPEQDVRNYASASKPVAHHHPLLLTTELALCVRHHELQL